MCESEGWGGIHTKSNKRFEKNFRSSKKKHDNKRGSAMALLDFMSYMCFLGDQKETPLHRHPQSFL